MGEIGDVSKWKKTSCKETHRCNKWNSLWTDDSCQPAVSRTECGVRQRILRNEVAKENNREIFLVIAGSKSSHQNSVSALHFLVTWTERDQKVSLTKAVLFSPVSKVLLCGWKWSHVLGKSSCMVQEPISCSSVFVSYQMHFQESPKLIWLCPPVRSGKP